MPKEDIIVHKLSVKDNSEYEFNQYQSELSLASIERAFNAKVGKEEPWTTEDVNWVYDQIANDINTIIFLKNLVSPERRKAKDMPKDEDGKIIVDFAAPHILENMEYFRELAYKLDKEGKYTNYNKNPHPMSKYRRFWKEQIYQCFEDKVREDGEWIPGDLYWFWNFGVIYQTQQRKRSKRGDRIKKIPKTHEGAYLWFHYKRRSFDNGKHSSILKSRGVGYSIMESFDMARDFILSASIETWETKSPVKTYAIADSKEYLDKDGILTKFVEAKTAIGENTEFPRICRLKNSLSDMHWQMGYKQDGQIYGSLNELYGVTINNNPQKARGKRGSKIKWEEVGSMPGFITAWQVERPSVEDGEIAFGHMVCGGTGGDELKNFKGLYTAYYEPGTLNIYGIPGVCDRKATGDRKVGFFYGAYLNRFNCHNKDGVSDIVKAMIEIYLHRWVVKQSSDPNLYIQAKAEHPITPQEAVLRKEGSLFPINDLRIYLENEVEPKLAEFISPHYYGELKRNSNGFIEYKNETDKRVIRDWPLSKTADRKGAIEMYVMPQRGGDGKIPAYRYIAGVDPYDADEGTSLGSIFIFDLWNDKIVAEYTGRPDTANEFYETCLTLIEYYNATANYENNLKGFFVYASNTNRVHLLAPTPQILRDVELLTGALKGNNQYGTRATEFVNKYARKLLADWLIKLRDTEYDEDGEPLNRILNLHTLRSTALIKELIMWNPDDNFDRVSAMGMLMIYRESMLKRIESAFSYDELGDVSTDPFFTGEYDSSWVEQSFALSNRIFGDDIGSKVKVQTNVSYEDIIDF